MLGSVASGRPVWRKALTSCQPKGSNSTAVLDLQKYIDRFINWEDKAKVCRTWASGHKHSPCPLMGGLMLHIYLDIRTPPPFSALCAALPLAHSD